MSVCPFEFCLFPVADWNVWAEHVRLRHQRIPCTVVGCLHIFKEQRVYRRHFVRDHTETGRYRCSACVTVYKSKQTAVKHCKKCLNGGRPVAVDAGLAPAASVGDNTGDEAVADEDAANGDAAALVEVVLSEGDAVGAEAVVVEDAVLVKAVPNEGGVANVEEEVAAALAMYRAPLVVPLSPLREEPAFVPPVVRVDIHLLVAVPNGMLGFLNAVDGVFSNCYLAFLVYLDLPDRDLINVVGRERLQRIGGLVDAGTC